MLPNVGMSRKELNMGIIMFKTKDFDMHNSTVMKLIVLVFPLPLWASRATTTEQLSFYMTRGNNLGPGKKVHVHCHQYILDSI